MQETALFVGILVFMSSWNFVLSWVEHEKSFINLGPGLSAKTRYWYWFFFSCYIYATEELCHKGTLYRSYAERRCQILFARKFQAANIAGFGDMVYNVLPKWPFISVMLSHFENQTI